MLVDDFPVAGHRDWFLDAGIGALYRLVFQHIGRLCLGCLKLGFLLRVVQPVVCVPRSIPAISSALVI